MKMYGYKGIKTRQNGIMSLLIDKKLVSGGNSWRKQCEQANPIIIDFLQGLGKRVYRKGNEEQKFTNNSAYASAHFNDFMKFIKEHKTTSNV